MRDKTNKAVTVGQREPGDERAYGAPALEKGLDVLELLASRSASLSQSEIAHSLGRSLQEVYRVFLVLERRGFIGRALDDGRYRLSGRMYALANQHPPLRRLCDVAQPVMYRFVREANQAVHLAVLEGTAIRVVAQVDSPAPLGFRLRVGTESPAGLTASGRTLLAFQPEEVLERFLSQISSENTRTENDSLLERIEMVRVRGYEIISSEGLQGVTDVSLPILNADGHAEAVLTMPFLAGTKVTVPFKKVARFQIKAAREISGFIGGNLDIPNFQPEKIITFV